MKKDPFIILVVIGIVTGLLLTWQFATGLPLSSNFPTDEIEARDELLNDFLDEQGYLQSRIVFLRNEIDEAHKVIEEQSEIASLPFLDDLKQDIGLSEIRGAGVEILLDDSPFAIREGVEVSDENLVQAADIRDIVNVLNAANADAISVNNQRVIATSPITSVGTSLLINNAYVAPPFTINAVGDSEIILQRLLNESLLAELYERVSTNHLSMQISVKNIVDIPIYNGNLRTNYLNLID